MNLLPDLSAYPPMEPRHIAWLRERGVPVKGIARAMPIRTASGFIADDGRFEDGHGPLHLVFEQGGDAVFWQPRAGRIGTALGRSFALGEQAVDDPATYSFDCNLNLWPDPLDWLRARCDGIVVIDWNRAWSRLHETPRVAVHESLLPLYRTRMKPPRGPEVHVLTARVATTPAFPTKDTTHEPHKRAA